MNESISDEAVYRTAPATPGLLKMHIAHFGAQGTNPLGQSQS